MSAVEISTTEAKQDKLFYVVANIIIVDTANQACLLLKRGDDEKVLPGKWAFPGGKLEHANVKELLEEAGTPPIEGVENILGILAAREAKEECGLDVEPDGRVIMNKVFIRPDGIPVFMALLASNYIGGEVVIEDGAISDHAWATKDTIDDYDTIKGIKELVLRALA